MGDWPASPQIPHPPRVVITSWGFNSMVGDTMAPFRLPPTLAGAWPANNRALYIPFTVESPITAYQLAMYNGAVAGNVDAGLYSYSTGTTATRLVSVGSTGMAGANVLQVFDITDTALLPGMYFMAFVASTITTATFFRSQHAALILTASGMQQEALGATTLPATAALANLGTSFAPAMAVIGRALAV